MKTNKITYGIKVSKLSKDGKSLKEIEGYAWKTDTETKEQFYMQKTHEVPLGKNTITLDLIEFPTEDILDTITISTKRYEELKR